MLDEQHRHVAFVGEPADQPRQIRALALVEPGRGFVQHHDRRTGSDRPRDADEAAPAVRRVQVAATADVIVAGRESVDIVAAVTALAGRGHRRILTEGGPYLLSQIIEAGLLDDLCLTLSPVLAGPGAGRIVADLGPLREPGGVDGRRLSLAHVLADDGHLLCRYVRPAG